MGLRWWEEVRIGGRFCRGDGGRGGGGARRGVYGRV